jgi:hypothetical protein
MDNERDAELYQMWFLQRPEMRADRDRTDE